MAGDAGGMIDFGKWRFVLSIVQMLGIIGIGLYTWWTNREKITNCRFVELEKEVAGRPTVEDLKKIDTDRDGVCGPRGERIDQLENRVLRIETVMPHMPTHKHLQGLSQDIGQLRSELSELSGRLQGINRAVDLINQFLIEQGDRK